MKINNEINRLPKAELHVHIEGTLTPAMARRIAARNQVSLDPSLFTADGNGFAYETFFDLIVKSYPAIANSMRYRQDYEDVAYDYLTRCAAEGSIYEELIVCPGQCARAGISWRDMIDGCAAGIDRARADTGIETRLNATFERHRSVEEARKDAALILSYPHDYIVGLDIAGGETEGDLPQFLEIYNDLIDRFEKVTGRKLGRRLHAIECAGPRNGWDALKYQPTRGGHFVRATEDPALMRELARREITLEVCPTSNICLVPQYQGDWKKHPLRELYNAGVRVTLNSDDPGLFGNCSIGGEYRIAHEEFGFKSEELLGMTRTAIEAAFVDEGTRARLLRKVNDFKMG